MGGEVGTLIDHFIKHFVNGVKDVDEAKVKEEDTSKDANKVYKENSFHSP